MSVDAYLFPVAAVLLVLGLAFLWVAGRRHQQSGLPSGRIIYTDTSGWGKVANPLYDSQLNITGKPDYLVQQSEGIIPVEYKSRSAPNEPFASHVYQVAMYCLLVEKTAARRPPYGIIRYNNRSFAVDYTPELEASLLDLLAEIRRSERRRSVNRSHENPALCNACGYRQVCDQALT